MPGDGPPRSSSVPSPGDRPPREASARPGDETVAARISPRARDEASLPTSEAPTEDLGTRSVLESLGPESSRAGVSLRELEAEEPQAAVRSGPDKYQVLKTLGEGGMGKVFAVYDRDLKRRVALKMIRASGDRPMEKRFLEEAQVMGQLQHPNILSVHDLGLTEAGKLYYTMPLVRGRSLKDVLDDLRRGEPRAARTYSLTRLVQVFLQVAQAVSYAHARGVLHRDLKPGNVMLGEHGEVQVLDWGLAKVVEGGQVRTDLAGSLTRSGHIVGTPSYMSPEQARGEEADERTDVYALGVLLYEMLTLQVPFAGSSFEVLQAVVLETPPAPRAKAPARSIPLELEQACLRALAKGPADRQGSVDGLVSEVQRWLEAETDRARRRERADEKAVEGRARLAEYLRLEDEVARLQEAAAEVATRFQAWQPAEEKAERFAAEDRVTAVAGQLVKTASAVVMTLSAALGFDPEHAEARSLLADYYWNRLRDAERRGLVPDGRFFAELVAAYHDGKYTRELKGDGTLVLTTDPPGARAWLYDLVEEGPVLVERNRRLLGTTPLPPTPLPMGSYVVVLERKDYRDTRYPVCITRNREWSGTVRLRTEEETGPGFVHVPAGPCVIGGDEEAWNALPRSEPWLPDFFIAEHPVTTGEYLAYLNDVARTQGLDEARKRGPRRVEDEPRSGYLIEDGQGGLKLPEVDTDGDRWDARIPVTAITWQDAIGYCAWRSQRDGREYRLPSEEEWEKAARGVDGRWYPWGWRFDPSLCNMQESLRERPAAVVVEEFPRDVSVYGVRGLGGNVRDWTASELVQGEGAARRVYRVYRGGLWGGSARVCRAAFRNWNALAYVFDGLGFRLARSG